MPQLLKCPKCSSQMQVPDGMAGKQVRCPKKECQNIITVPAGTPVMATAGSSHGGVKAAVAPAPAPPRQATGGSHAAALHPG